MSRKVEAGPQTDLPYGQRPETYRQNGYKVAEG